jgi:stearoyl-CoA desaturase (delta-9 desaturase)
MIALSAITITLLVIGTIPVAYLIATFCMWCLISGLGVAVGYHRVFSHRTHHLPRWKENVILFFGALSGQGSSITWTAIHRGYHHPHSDTARDPHSPTKGLWHSFFGWTLDITEEQPRYSFKYAIDLLRRPNHLWFHKHQLKILWLTPLLVAVLNWKLALTACVLPTGIALLMDNLVNIVGHRKLLIGYRNFETQDQSQNNLLFGYLSWGQGFHNSHHAHPATFDFGDRWYEFDPCRLWRWFLE